MTNIQLPNICFNIDDITFSVTNISTQKITTPYPKHCHSKISYEIHYIPFGYGTLIANDITYEIQPNTLYITGPNIMHEQIPNPIEPMVEYCINLDVLSKSSSALKCNTVSEFLLTPFWHGTDNQNILVVFQELFDELTHQYIGYTHNLESLCKMLIILIIRNYQKCDKSFTIFPEFSVSTAAYLTIENAFLDNYKGLTLASLAAQIGLSTRQTERLLKEQYGKTFRQKKVEARMSAALLLLEDNLSISDIAEKLGYSSSEHFSNAFKQFYSVSPTKYKKNKSSLYMA